MTFFGTSGAIILFYSLFAEDRLKLHVGQIIANALLLKHAITISDLTFCIVNGLLLTANVIQYIRIRKGVIKNG